MEDDNFETILSDLRNWINSERPSLTALPDGDLESADQAIHQMFRGGIDMARSLSEHDLGMAGAKARVNIRRAGNILADELVSRRADLERVTGRQFPEDIDVITLAVHTVRKPDADATLTQSLRELSPVSRMCIDGAQLYNRARAFAEASMSPGTRGA